MEVVSIIPARGGSKGVPRKNILELAGKPLIAYAIESAIQSQYVNRVVVSTDHPEIERISKEFGAEVVKRPAELSTDTSSSEEALIHVLDHLRQVEGYESDLIVFIQCTSPLTLPEDIDATVQALVDDKTDCAFAAVPFHYFLWKKNSDIGAEGINHDKNIRLMRQDRGNQFLEAGAIYVMKTDAFKKAKHRFFGKTSLHVMPKERCFEIDDPVDFKIAEVLMRERMQYQRSALLPSKIEAIALDFDGVFTDNRVIVMEDGKEGIICNRSDGYGFSMLRKYSLPLKVFSTERNPVVKKRCDKLEIPCAFNIKDKLSELKKWLLDIHVDPANVIFVGNDINDLSCMRYVGCPIAVSDSYPEIKNISHIVLNSSGGNGALRELVGLIQKKMEATHA